MSGTRRSGKPTGRWGWRIAVVGAIAVALIAGIAWLAMAPQRAQAALAERSHRLLEGLLDGDALTTAQLVDTSTYSGTIDVSQLNRAGAEAALGAPVRVRTDAVVERRVTAETTSTVGGPRGSFEVTIRYRRSSKDGAWEQQQVSFPRLDITPRGTHSPARVLVNGLAVEYPDGEPNFSLALWPSPSTTLTYPDDGGYCWDAAELGRVPASSLTGNSTFSTSLAANPVATLLPESRRKAEAAVRTWIEEGLTRLERSPSEGLSDAPVSRTGPPLYGRRGSTPELRRLRAEVLAQPRLTLLSEAEMGLYAERGLPGASLRGGRIKITGQWLDGTTWRDFTDVESLYVEGAFSADFSTFSSRW